MKILLLNQCFYPDVVATAQYTSDLASMLTGRGHQVTVIASNRGYDDPSNRFPGKESWNGVQIVRVPCLATGKGKRWKRALNIASFFLTCCSRLLLIQKFEVVIALTSPPLISALAAMFIRIRGGRFIFWIMDLNPDEAIAAGWLKEGSRTARLLESVLRFSANTADRVVVLDRFMSDRMVAKGLSARKISILPPWSHDQEVAYDAEGRAAFRATHGLAEKYVVMYSGNHSPCHPLETVLQAALALADEQGISFCFVGGGSEYANVRSFAERHNLRNVVLLRYQKLTDLAASLSSADLHLVVMGQRLVGLVHPSKIYNVLAIGVPMLYVGPADSHLGDIAEANPDLPITRLEHGDVTGVVARIRLGASGMVPNERMREVARAFSANRILAQHADVLESLEEPVEPGVRLPIQHVPPVVRRRQTEDV
jgi:colanic acid biosynthesis glycosyl transferase WcaI